MSSTARPELVRPFTTKNAPNSARYSDDRQMYSARNQFTQIKNSKDQLTSDDIVNLKREKQNLIQERSILKAKIARFSNITHKPKAPGRNQQIANSLEKQVHTLEQLTAAKRAEIAQLIYSDHAAVITELQEESKMLHLELMRLQRNKRETELELKDISAQLEDACQKYSPAVLNRQHRTIKNLEKEISAQRKRNDLLKAKLDAMKQEQSQNKYQDVNDKIQKSIDSLKAKIRAEQQQISEIDQQIAGLKDQHAREMLELQSQL